MLKGHLFHSTNTSQEGICAPFPEKFSWFDIIRHDPNKHNPNSSDGDSLSPIDLLPLSFNPQQRQVTSVAK